MKIQPANSDNFVQNPDKNIRSVLFYGPDTGLISHRANIYTKAIIDDLSDPFRIVDFNFKDIKDNPAKLRDEIFAMTLTGGTRLIKIRDIATTIPKEIQEILLEDFTETFVIFLAGELSPSSTLRKFFEKTNNIAALACYKDDDRSIARVAGDLLRQHNFTFDHQVVNLLVNRFSGDRMIILSEVEKLITYMGDETRITADDIIASIDDSSEMSLEELCNAIASKNNAKIELYLNKAYQEGVAPITIIRTISRYFSRLEEVKLKMTHQKISEQQAISSLKPPIFFKQVPIFKGHLKIWNEASISKVLKNLVDLEISCKQTGSPAELLCARFMTILPFAAKAS